MPDIPDNVPIYVSSDYGDDEPNAEEEGRSAGQGSPLSRDQLMHDRPAQGWAPFSPGESKVSSLARESGEAGVPADGYRVKTEEQLAQSGIQSFRMPRSDKEKVFVFGPRTTVILVVVTSLNLFLVGLWAGRLLIPHEPVMSSTKPGVESLFGLLGKGKGKPMTEPTEAVALAVAKASPAVVNIDIKFDRVRGAINNLDENGSMPSGEATGLIIRSDGYIVTNAHVVAGPTYATDIKVTLSTGKSYQAKVIGVDDFSDIAVIKIETDNLPVLKFASDSDVHPGDLAIAIGSPLGFDHTVSLGVVSAVNRSLAFFNNHVSLIQHDAALNFGNSGGPLLNIRGEVIGINTAVKEKAQGIGFATPAEVVADVVEQLIAKAFNPQALLGHLYAGHRSQSLTFPDPAITSGFGANKKYRFRWTGS